MSVTCVDHNYYGMIFPLHVYQKLLCVKLSLQYSGSLMSTFVRFQTKGVRGLARV